MPIYLPLALVGTTLVYRLLALVIAVWISGFYHLRGVVEERSVRLVLHVSTVSVTADRNGCIPRDSSAPRPSVHKTVPLARSRTACGDTTNACRRRASVCRRGSAIGTPLACRAQATGSRVGGWDGAVRRLVMRHPAGVGTNCCVVSRTRSVR